MTAGPAAGRRVGAGRLVSGRALAAGLALVAAAATLAACGSAAPGNASPPAAAGRLVRVVAAENFWGSIASQVGGVHVAVSSIITNPSADPHSYEPTPADARTIADSAMVILNGIGYDGWAGKLVAADQVRPTVLNVGNILGLRPGDNPHRWYNPGDVQAVIAAMVADFSKLDPADRAYFQAERDRYDTVALQPYHQLITEIRSRYSGTPVGASESIFAMLAPALGLDLVTPPAFLRAISEGSEVSAADKSTIDGQIRHHRIKIYVYNSQNTTPDVQAQVAECRAEHIPTATITETLVPPGATYQQWQTSELEGILAALRQGAGR